MRAWCHGARIGQGVGPRHARRQAAAARGSGPGLRPPLTDPARRSQRRLSGRGTSRLLNPWPPARVEQGTAQEPKGRKRPSDREAVQNGHSEHFTRFVKSAGLAAQEIRALRHPSAGMPNGKMSKGVMDAQNAATSKLLTKLAFAADGHSAQLRGHWAAKGRLRVAPVPAPRGAALALRCAPGRPERVGTRGVPTLNPWPPARVEQGAGKEGESGGFSEVPASDARRDAGRRPKFPAVPVPRPLLWRHGPVPQ